MATSPRKLQFGILFKICRIATAICFFLIPGSRLSQIKIKLENFRQHNEITKKTRKGIFFSQTSFGLSEDEKGCNQEFTNTSFGLSEDEKECNQEFTNYKFAIWRGILKKGVKEGRFVHLFSFLYLQFLASYATEVDASQWTVCLTMSIILFVWITVSFSRPLLFAHAFAPVLRIFSKCQWNNRLCDWLVQCWNVNDCGSRKLRLTFIREATFKRALNSLQGRTENFYPVNFFGN